MSIFKNEKTPTQIIDDSNIKDKLHFSLYRADTSTEISRLINIISPGNVTTYLPKIIPQGVDITKYIIISNKNIIESHDTTDFKINMNGNYLYSIQLTATLDITGGFIIQLVDANGDVYNNGTMETFGDIFTNSKTFYLYGIVQHKKNDIVKIRFQSYTIPNINDVRILSISNFSCSIEL
jgi:hypothetical protein